MDHRTALLLLGVVTAFVFSPASAQQCLSGAAYTCVGLNYFMGCNDGEADNVVTPCSDLMSDSVCFPGQGGEDSPCAAPPDCMGPGRFLLAGRCDIFYDCIDIGIPNSFSVTIHQCIAGFHYSRATSRCESEAIVGCNPSTPPPGGSCNNPNATYPDPENCARYFTCSEDGKLALETCPGKTLYVPTMEECVWWDLDCEERPNPYNPQTTQTTPQATSTTTATSPACSPGARTPDVNQCNLYRECNLDGVQVTRTCPIPQLFDVGTLACAPFTNCGSRVDPFSTTTVRPTDPTCVANSRMPDPEHCGRYYVCEPTNPCQSPKVCPFNMLFDIPTAACARETECGTRFRP